MRWDSLLQFVKIRDCVRFKYMKACLSSCMWVFVGLVKCRANRNVAKVMSREEVGWKGVWGVG